MKKFTLNIREIPKEFKFILELLKNDDDRYIQKLLTTEYSHMDWKIFLELVLHHRVYPLLASKLHSYNLIPPIVVQTINTFYKKNIFKMLELSGEMERIGILFNSTGIKSIFLKGPILGKEIYGDISLRTCGDLDLLIPIEDLDIANKLLEDNGYVKDDYIQSALEDWKWRHHHVTYYHSSKNIKVEIHWRLNPGPGKEPSLHELWERKRISPLSKSPIYYLGREDLFLFLVSHGARHGWSRLRWLLDVHHMIDQGIDWKKVSVLVKKYNNFNIIGQSIILSSQLLDAKISEEMNKFIDNKRAKSLAQASIFYFDKMISLHNEPLPKDIHQYHGRYLFSLMSFNQKILFLLSYLYPYYVDTITFPLPKKLHFLYFFLRPFLCIWRKARKHELSLEEPK